MTPSTGMKPWLPILPIPASPLTSCASSWSGSNASRKKKAGIASDIKDVYAELKGRGFDTKAIRQIVRLRKQDHTERQEQEAILELYMQALGMS